MSHYLKISAGEKVFDDYVVFQNVDYQFDAGKLYALVGPSGGGKTTLLNSIGRLDELTAGMIELDGTDVNSIKILKYYRDYIGYLFQNYALVDEETVEKNLNLVKKNSRAKLILHLQEYGLGADYLKRKVFTLSGGEAQRVALARLSLQDPLIILADEPTGALDNENRQVVLDSLRKMATKGKIVIIATHDNYVKEYVDECVDIMNFK